MMSEAQARSLILQAWPNVLPNVKPNLAALQAVQSVGREETGYGANFNGNWGAIQGGRPDDYGNCPPGTFGHGDTHANGTGYAACFKLYSSTEAAVEDLIRQVFKSTGADGKPRSQTVLPAAMSGDQIAFDTALRKSGYYELPLDQHIKATTYSVQKIAAALHEPIALCPGCHTSSLKKYIFWSAVAALTAAAGAHYAMRRAA
jgi:hypothetical protein